MRRLNRYTKQAAYHEAGHAVARLYVGAPPTLTEINVAGGGISHGTGLLWETPGTSQCAVWDLLIVLLAGPYAEARMSRRSRLWVLLSAGRDDFAAARAQVAWLLDPPGTPFSFVQSEDVAWMRAERETKDFLKAAWPDIVKVAGVLLRTGRIEATELVTITKTRSMYGRCRVRYGDLKTEPVRTETHFS